MAEFASEARNGPGSETLKSMLRKILLQNDIDGTKVDTLRQEIQLAENKAGTLRQEIQLAETKANNLRQEIQLAETKADTLRQEIQLAEISRREASSSHEIYLVSSSQEKLNNKRKKDIERHRLRKNKKSSVGLSAEEIETQRRTMRNNIRAWQEKKKKEKKDQLEKEKDPATVRSEKLIESERIENKRLRANERHRKYLASLSQEKMNERRQKERDRCRQWKSKLFAGMSEEEIENQRQIWREEARARRERQRKEKAISPSVQNVSEKHEKEINILKNCLSKERPIIERSKEQEENAFCLNHENLEGMKLNDGQRCFEGTSEFQAESKRIKQEENVFCFNQEKLEGMNDRQGYFEGTSEFQEESISIKQEENVFCLNQENLKGMKLSDGQRCFEGTSEFQAGSKSITRTGSMCKGKLDAGHHIAKETGIFESCPYSPKATEWDEAGQSPTSKSETHIKDEREVESECADDGSSETSSTVIYLKTDPLLETENAVNSQNLSPFVFVKTELPAESDHFDSESSEKPNKETICDVNEDYNRVKIKEELDADGNGSEELDAAADNDVHEEKVVAALFNEGSVESDSDDDVRKSTIDDVRKSTILRKVEDSKELSGFSFASCHKQEPYVVSTSTASEKRCVQTQTAYSCPPRTDQLLSYYHLSEERLSYFTGISRGKFQVLLSFLTSRKMDHFFVKSLPDEDQLLLVLFKNKHSLSNEYLANLFGVTERQVSTTLINVMNSFKSSLNDGTLWSVKKTKCTLQIIIECRDFIAKLIGLHPSSKQKNRKMLSSSDSQVS